MSNLTLGIDEVMAAIDTFYIKHGYHPHTVLVTADILCNLYRHMAVVENSLNIAFYKKMCLTHSGVHTYVEVDHNMPDGLSYYFNDIMVWLDGLAEDILLKGE